MRVAIIFSFFVFFVNGNVFGSNTQNSLNIDKKETEIEDIRLEVNVMKGNYHDLLKRVIDNENTIELLENDKQYLTNEVENLKRQLSCEIEELHVITGEHQQDLNETNFDLDHSGHSFNKTVQELGYKVDVLETKLLCLERKNSEESLEEWNNKTEVVSVCTFETIEEENCVFYNDETGLDKRNWIRHLSSTKTCVTDPCRSMAGNYYMYTDNLNYLDNALLVSKILQQGVKLCLSFNYNFMYGPSSWILEVIASSSGNNRTIFTTSGIHSYQWFYKKLYIQPECNLQIMFNGIDTANYNYGKISLDNIMLFTGECGPQTFP
ncbi:Hypothetical predicted protein [Mytilus galloprovincialis]|uniref:MAM domain-containing protein n=1 Tax=Mytilus galloprovincialis TaxID=29158 RepID=A0A8B6H321_MYTGA|nr:Hypothetical predicted protein [Mytilus galloprovincialis]